MAPVDNLSQLLVIVGETASGKSTLAIELAQKFNGELMCADSWTVYKGFNIGTAKPSREDQQKVPHHLLDVADAPDGFSAVLFQRLVKSAMANITARGKLPILVGGTGLYVDSVIFNYGFLPPSDPHLRAELNAMTLDGLLERAGKFGLSTANIDIRNKRRVIRLIENNGQLPTKQALRPNTLVLGLAVPREDLRQRVEERVDAMLTQGLEGEVRHLAAQYGWQVEPMKGIGYAEWRPYYDGIQNLAETRERIIASTMSLAKRQRTWFKRNKSIHPICNQAEAVELVTTWLNKKP